MIKKPYLKRTAFYWDKTCLQAKRLIRNRRYKKASELGGFFAKNEWYRWSDSNRHAFKGNGF